MKLVVHFFTAAIALLPISEAFLTEEGYQKADTFFLETSEPRVIESESSKSFDQRVEQLVTNLKSLVTKFGFDATTFELRQNELKKDIDDIQNMSYKRHTETARNLFNLALNLYGRMYNFKESLKNRKHFRFPGYVHIYRMMDVILKGLVLHNAYGAIDGDTVEQVHRLKSAVALIEAEYSIIPYRLVDGNLIFSDLVTRARDVISQLEQYARIPNEYCLSPKNLESCIRF